MILKQKEAPFDKTNYEGLEPGSHKNKMVFRLLVPLIAKGLNLTVWGIYALVCISGIITIYLAGLITFNLFNDRIIASIVTISTPLILAGKLAFLQTTGVFDGLSIFLLVLSMAVKNPFAIASCVFLAGWNDERALVASSLTFVYFAFNNLTHHNYLRAIINPQTIAVVMAWILYVSLRLYLIEVFGLNINLDENSGVGFTILLLNKYRYLTETLKSLEGFWLYVIFSFWLLFKSRNYLLVAGYFLGIALIFLAAFAVWDVDRSCAYVFPAVFIALLIIKKYGYEPNDLKNIALIVLLICFIWPYNPLWGFHDTTQPANNIIYEILIHLKVVKL